MAALAFHLTRRRAVAVLLAVGLASCAGAPPPPAPAPIDDGRRPVAEVVDIELGRTTFGYALTVFGLTDTAGWGQPALVRRERGTDADGFIVLEFLARPPATPPTEPTALLPEVRRVRADILFDMRDIAGVAGVRILSAGPPAVVNFN